MDSTETRYEMVQSGRRYSNPSFEIKVTASLFSARCLLGDIKIPTQPLSPPSTCWGHWRRRSSTTTTTNIEHRERERERIRLLPGASVDEPSTESKEKRAAVAL